MKKLVIIFLSCILLNSCSVMFDPGYRTVYHDGHDVVYYRYDNRYRPIYPSYHYRYTPKTYHTPPPPKHHGHKPNHHNHHNHHKPYRRK